MAIFVVLVALGVALAWWHVENKVKNNTALKVVTDLYFLILAIALGVAYISFLTF